jgi:ribosomal protein S18 acetylase RimI-like enzyme
MSEFSAAAPSIEIREAEAGDLRAIVELLADDVLGAKRERLADPLPAAYHEAFAAIAADPHQRLLVAARAGVVVACLQLTFIPGITHHGAWRAQIEGVRVARGVRGSAVGTQMVEHAVDMARQHGCRIVQLTTDKQRADARRFYERLGFAATHEGMKLSLR